MDSLNGFSKSSLFQYMILCFERRIKNPCSRFYVIKIISQWSMVVKVLLALDHEN